MVYSAHLLLKLNCALAGETSPVFDSIAVHILIWLFVGIHVYILAI